MSSTDDEVVYEVERIFAERIQDGEVQYLTKWQNYDDQECTWEPKENFNNIETLKVWKKQKANGDVLEGDELRRIQSKMDAFQAANVTEKDDSEQTSEGESDPDFDELLQPPPKRLKLIRDPPPLSNKSRSSRNPTYTQRSAARTSKGTRSPISQKAGNSKTLNAVTENPMRRPQSDATTSTGRLGSTSSKNAATKESSLMRNREQAGKSNLPPVRKTAAPPMTFHAPDIIQRKQRISNVSADLNTKHDAVGKPFKNLRHQNNARKRRAENYEQPRSTSASNPTRDQAKDPSEPSGQVPVATNRAPTEEPGESIDVQDEDPMEELGQAIVGRNENLAEVSGQATGLRPETNDSWLFFSDDERGEPRAVKVEQVHEKNGPMQVPEQQTTVTREAGGQAETATPQVQTSKPQGNTDRDRARLVPTPLKVQTKSQNLASQDKGGHGSEDVQNGRRPTEPRLNHNNAHILESNGGSSSTVDVESAVRETATKARDRPTPGAISKTAVRHDRPAQACISDNLPAGDIATIITKPKPVRRNSLFGQPTPLAVPGVTKSSQITVVEALPDKLLPCAPARVEERQPEPSVIDTVSKKPPHALARVEDQCPDWRPGYTQSTVPSHPSRDYVPEGQIVRAAGREWVKGDMVIDLSVNSHKAGGVRVQHGPWNWNKSVIKLKENGKHTLPVNFNYTISHADYVASEKMEKSWIYYGIAAVEPFEDTADTFSLLAKHLENSNSAACWYHPQPLCDLMLVLYSCQSSAWANLDMGSYTHTSTRGGERRVNIIYRNKLNLHSQISALQETQMDEQNTARGGMEDRDVNMTDVRVDYRREPRSRRTSMVSDASSRTHDDVLKSPSEQLTREMADYALNNKTRRDSSIFDDIVRPPVPSENIPSDARQNLENIGTTITASPKELTAHTPIATDPRLRITIGNRKDTIIEQLDTSATNSPVEGNSTTRLDRRLEELSRTGSSNKCRDQRDVNVLLFFKQDDLRKAQKVQEWLVKQVPDRNQVRIQSTDAVLRGRHDESWTYETWTNLILNAKRGEPCVLIFDVNFPVYRLEGLGKVLYDYDNVLCWQVDIRATYNTSMKTTRIFPTGQVMAIAQDCFLVCPEDVTYILKWFKKRVDKPFSASRLILPPKIESAIEEQVGLSSHQSTKSMFRHLLTMIMELRVLSEAQANSLDDLGFSVVSPEWGDVYSDDVAISNCVPAFEQKGRDRAMSDEFLKHFGAWAMTNMTVHRQFMGFTTKLVPSRNEHIRFWICRTFVAEDRKLGEREKERRSRSRDPSAGRDRERERERERDRTRARSRDRGGNERSRAESRG